MTYDPLLVCFSFLVSTFGAYVAIRTTYHARRSPRTTGSSNFWLSQAAAAFGAGGIWSMHFIAMAAVEFPVPVRYDLLLTALSLVVAVGATGVGFSIALAGDWGHGKTVVSGLVMGVGISGMHYIGMAAMRMPASFEYDRVLVALSVAVGVLASIAAIALVDRPSYVRPPVAAVVMAIGVSGMHYVGMSAANLVQISQPARVTTVNVTPATLAYIAFLVTIVVLSIQLGLAAKLPTAREAVAEQ